MCGCKSLKKLKKQNKNVLNEIGNKLHKESLMHLKRYLGVLGITFDVWKYFVTYYKCYVAPRRVGFEQQCVSLLYRMHLVNLEIYRKI